MKVFKDQLNRSLTLPKTPTRIVSLVPSQTELLSDLGLQDSIIGVTKFCVYPNNIRDSKAVVGGTKQVKLKRIIDLKPDIILCNKEENSQEIIESLSSVAPIHISDIYTIEDCIELMIMYGDLFNIEKRVNALISKLQKNAAEFSKWVADQPKLKVAYFIWKEPWMIAANNTFINHLLGLNNFENVFSNQKRYPEITLEQEELRNTDVVLLSSEPYPFKDKHVEELKHKLPNAKIKLVDGEYFSWYGSRLVHAFNYFKTLRLEVL